eukprot:CAMPEP_0203634586 /NCGR_PEP_ID=MMETSP0088-20131115/1487_1 /ASSEMBLY_ACC=CAM_ASM_001087 /TAXON_ID=426623 /ORGANISM="Chaetoceros affinis, Strain CCMP159" /LENGTH=79 /DNA_ID=CAMNT_0050488221 /DNA_START=39 /DNA_END=278 /DNA_ORIENTATION=+
MNKSSSIVPTSFDRERERSLSRLGRRNLFMAQRPQVFSYQAQATSASVFASTPVCQAPAGGTKLVKVEKPVTLMGLFSD